MYIMMYMTARAGAQLALAADEGTPANFLNRRVGGPATSCDGLQAVSRARGHATR